MKDIPRQELGLRQRNKLKRRAAIVSAALELFASRGYAATTIIDIAEAAEVAPRTISLYFPTKLEIALALPTEWAADLIETLRRRSGMSVLDAIAAWTSEKLSNLDRLELELLNHTFATNPELRSLNALRMEPAANEITTEFIAEQGLTVDQPRARIAAVAMLAIIENIWFAARNGDVNEEIALSVEFLKYGLSGKP